MKQLIMFGVILGLSWGMYFGYQKFNEVADNSATHYTGGLQQAEKKAQAAAGVASVATLKEAISNYHASKGKNPDTLDDLVKDGFLDKMPDGNFTYNAGSGEVTQN